ncbi:MAG: hypothetical protein PHD15_01665 [Clostridia bacterium]|nr:hypothetical protein [Clostridia bacterium]MDD4386458.1 hypothetical protein [Clostridia bacterium]
MMLETNGYIDQATYDDFIIQLNSTGNLYDIDIEAYKKILILDANTVDADDYIEQYKFEDNDDIFKAMDTTNILTTNGKLLKEKAYLLNKDDQIYVKLKNENITMAGALFQVIIPTSKKERIVVNYGGVVNNSSWDKVEAEIHSFSTKPSIPSISADGIGIGSSITLEAGYNTNFGASSKTSGWWKKISKYVWTIKDAGGNIIQTGTNENLTNISDFVGTISRNITIGTPISIEVYVIDEYEEISDTKIVTIYAANTLPSIPTLNSSPTVLQGDIISVFGGSTTITFNAVSTIEFPTGSGDTGVIANAIDRYDWIITDDFGTRTQSGNSFTGIFKGNVTVKVTAKDVEGHFSLTKTLTFRVQNL